jgi:ubiquinol-cytochrome c reductase cytochrome b subunit
MSYWGIFMCPKWFEILNIGSNINIFSISLPFILPRTRAQKRIGPHNYDILSILIGSLLGDGYAERHGHGTRLCFQQEHLNYRYLLWFHKYLSELGYCTTTVPKISKRLGPGGKLRYISRFKTYTFASFNWIHTAFYKNGIKIIPFFLSEYLSPLALAVLIMDDGVKVSSGLKIATNSFSKSEVEELAILLRNKYGLKVSIISAGYINQYNLYFSKSTMKTLAQIIKPYLHTSMYYKFNGYI